MKVIGGSFGVKGSAVIAKQLLHIDSSKKVKYAADQISDIATRIEKEKVFGWFGAIVGGVLLAVVLGFFLNVIGILIGIGLAFALSFKTEKRNIAEVQFNDGSHVTLDCTPRAIKKLLNFKT